MNYCIYVEGRTHKLIQGVTFSDEYNETLDSATAIISESPQLDLNPYDDVFIFGEWCGYYDKLDKTVKPIIGKKFVFKGFPVNATNYDYGEMPCFYKHFLIDKFTEDLVILGDSPENSVYKYKFELFSEIKGAEKVQAPNISVTQPLDNKIPTVTYLNRFLSLYNKKKKVLNANFSDYTDFHYENRYTLANSNSLKKKYACLNEYVDKSDSFPFEKGKIYLVKNLKGELDENVSLVENSQLLTDSENTVIITKTTGPDYYNIDNDYKYAREVTEEIVIEDFLELISDVFGDSYCPDFTLNAPTLRQILDKFLITKDRIAVIRDDEIYSMDITKRRGDFDLTKGEINYVSGSKSSSNYCTELRRTYTDGLCQDNAGRLIEYLGFRNSDVALMTLENMRLETRFPIYKVNKIYMCYLKRVTVTKTTSDGSTTTRDKAFICKQDITPLIKLNSERNVLSENATMFGATPPTTIEGLSRYKFGTLGYDIGSQSIEGWGQKFYYPGHFFWQNEVKSYIEAIFTFLEQHNQYGIYDANYIIDKVFGSHSDSDFFSINFPNPSNGTSIVIPNNYADYSQNVKNKIGNDDLNFFNIALKFKHIFFEMEYTPFFSGTVIHSKGLGTENITINDNQSASLSLLESDGLAQIEKLNRYGNKAILIPARYKQITDIQKLGSVYNKGNDTDVVIYHKEYSINDNVINCTYYGSKDYVLKDYYTSVFARYRTYNLMSYNESITRAENEKIYLYLSKDEYYIDATPEDSIEGFNANFKKKLVSFFEVNTSDDIKYGQKIDFKDKLNYGFFERSRYGYTERFATDSNIFVSGNSLCLNIAMKDNVTLGNYILNMKNDYIYSLSNNKNYMLGSTQDFVWITDDSGQNDGGTTGQVTMLGCYFGSVKQAFAEEIYDYSSVTLQTYQKLFDLPKITNSPTINNQIGFFKHIYKDNKEKLDITLQIEPIVDEDIFISSWFMKLSNMYGVYPKFAAATSASYTHQELINNVYLIGEGGSAEFTDYTYSMALIVERDKINQDCFGSLHTGGTFSIRGNNSGITISGTSTIKLVTVTSESVLTVICDEVGSMRRFNGDPVPVSASGVTYTFTKTTDSNYINNALTACGLLSEADKYHVFKTSSNTGGDFCGQSVYIVFDMNGFVQQSPNLIYYASVPKTYPFEKNLYWVSAPVNYDFKHYMVYDSFDSLPNNFTQRNVSIVWASDGSFFQVSHPDVPVSSYILCYYKYKGKYEFVFGFKSNNGTATRIYVSHLYSRDMRVFDPNTHLPVTIIPDSFEQSTVNLLEFEGYLNPVTMQYKLSVAADSQYPQVEYTFNRIVVSGLSLPDGQSSETFINQTVDSENEIILSGNYGSSSDGINVSYYTSSNKLVKQKTFHEIIDERCFEYSATVQDVVETSPGVELYNLNFIVKNKTQFKTITFDKVEFVYYVLGNSSPQRLTVYNFTLGPGEIYNTEIKGTTLQTTNIDLSFELHVEYYVDGNVLFDSGVRLIN